jgi:hypothetical protein
VVEAVAFVQAEGVPPPFEIVMIEPIVMPAVTVEMVNAEVAEVVAVDCGEMAEGAKPPVNQRAELKQQLDAGKLSEEAYYAQVVVVEPAQQQQAPPQQAPVVVVAAEAQPAVVVVCARRPRPRTCHARKATHPHRPSTRLAALSPPLVAPSEGSRGVMTFSLARPGRAAGRGGCGGGAACSRLCGGGR